MLPAQQWIDHFYNTFYFLHVRDKVQSFQAKGCRFTFQRTKNNSNTIPVYDHGIDYAKTNGDSKRAKNTFATFGASEDRTGYMSRYSFADSVNDGATLPLHFEPVPVKLHVDQAAIDEAFKQMADEAGLTEEEQSKIAQKVRMSAIMKDPNRIHAVCEHIADHFMTKINPNGFKAQVVCYDRECCVLYKKELDSLLGETVSTIVMDTNNDKADEYKQWRRSRDEEAKVLDNFRDPANPLKIVIVTSKLLTGFDAPILQVMYLDKPMKDHTLLQAICRTNRVYDQEKTYGLIVDYVGIFDDVAKALYFDSESVEKVISNIESVKDKVPELIAACVAFFPGVDRTRDDWEAYRSHDPHYRDSPQYMD